MFERGGPSFAELVQQALSSTERGYDLLAQKFDKTPFRTPDALLARIAPHVGEVGAALDICCGTGAGLEMLRPHVTERLVGLDMSAGMLEQARENLGDNVELAQGDALAMPFVDESFDLATSFGAFGHILEDDEERFCREVFRVLKPSGRFVFVTSEMPPLTSRTWWMARGFNAAMRVRNALIHPPFIMYYLTFTLPDVGDLLVRTGFRVDVHSLSPADDGRLSTPADRLRIVVATRPRS